jgi:5-(carboxyamino)imidazole ribonucleotide mutase
MSEAIAAIIMGSASDLNVMRGAAEMLDEFGVAYEMTVVSAHRTPKRMFDYAQNAHHRGIRVIIAGAGGAAHLPGMVASLTPLPVIGVPIKSANSLDGWDSLLSIAQMPKGVPVATVAVDGAQNAGLLAVQIVAAGERKLLDKLMAYKAGMAEKVEAMAWEVEHEQNKRSGACLPRSAAR